MPLRKAGPETQPVVSPAVEETVLKSAVMPKADKPMTRSDWDSKDRRISRAGLYQAALQSPALMQYAPTLADYQKLVEQIADAGLEYVNR